jgi:uncharacterized protein YndB with AHSA1/START domain
VPDIKMLVAIACEPRDVFPHIAGATGFANWWSDDIVMRAGGEVEIGMRDRTLVYRLRPETMVMPARAAWTAETGAEWSGTSLLFDLAPDGGGTRLLFSHSGWARVSELFLSTTALWGALLFRLKETAERGTPTPLFRRTSPTPR